MRVITICGSLKVQNEIMKVAEKMALDGNCILTPTYPVLENIQTTEEQLKKLKEEHFKRIELSDAILVVNINNYIGDSTNKEIEYAKKLKKEIIYYTDLIKNKREKINKENKINNEIVFVTHNTGKIKSAEKYFKNLKFTAYNYELDEPRSDDIKEIAKSKVMQAYKIVNRPCIALDTDFRIDELNGFPRAFVNFTLDTIGIDGILKLMENKNNRNCAFNECLAYHDGKEIHYFYGKHPGNLSYRVQGLDRKEKWSDLWYIFKPKGFEKTLAEMNEEEREKRRTEDSSYSAMEKFAEWYEKNN